MCEDHEKKQTGLHFEGFGVATLTVGEDGYVDIDETAFRVVRRDGAVDIVELDGSGGRVIASEKAS